MKLFTLLLCLSVILMFSVTDLFAHNVTLRLEDSDGVGLASTLQPRYGNGSSYQTSYWPGGPTQADGNTNPVDLTTGYYSFEMRHNGTTARKISVYIDGDVTLTWVTTTVTLQFSGQIRYGGSSGTAAYFKQYSAPGPTATKELLPGGTYKFRVDPSGVFDLTIGPPPSMTKSLVHLTLKDHNGDLLSGGRARGGNGSSYSTWWAAVNPTNEQGVAVDIRDGLKTNLSYQMLYNNGGQVIGPQDVSSNSFFEFETELVTLRLETCTPLPLDGGKARYGAGSHYYTSWWPGGLTGSSAAGEATAELFQGTYSFEMQYNGTSDRKISQTVSDGGATFVWQTTEVTLWYSGSISFGGGSGDARWFNKPTMELLPGTYKFHFRDGDRTDLTFIGCSFEKTITALRVFKSDGSNGPAGVTFIWQIHGSPPDQAVPGSTNSDGKLLHVYDGYNNALTRYIPTYENVTGNRRDPRPATQSIVDWSLVNITVQLTDHTNSVIATATPLVTYEYPGGGRQNFGNLVGGTLSKEMMSTSSYVAFFIDDFNDTKQRKDISPMNANTIHTFQCGRIVDGGHNTDHWRISGGNNNYGLVAAGSTGIEVLPNNYFYFYHATNPQIGPIAIAAGQTYNVGTGMFTKGSTGSGGEPIVAVPEVFKLYSAYPNPFNPTTTIKFTVKEANPTTLKVYNTLGQEIAILFTGTAEPGKFYQFAFDASNLGSGMYIYQLKSGDKVSVKQMMLTK